MRLVAGAACLAAVTSGCGDDLPPPAAENGSFAPGPPTNGPFGGTPGITPPGCGTKDDGSYCECLDVPLFTDAPNLYFVLDRSGSMSDEGKWNAVRANVAALLRGLGPRVNVAAAMFPAVADTCAPGREVMAMRRGDPPSSSADGPTTQLLLKVTAVKPGGGTPTSATLASLLPRIASFSAKTFVILATDGAPNCNPQASCTLATCQPNIEDAPMCPREGPSCCDPPTGARENCLDELATVEAVNGYAKAGIPVYVVGIPGSAPYADLLDQLAVVGGTALPTTPRYYRVDSTGDQALLGALRKVAAKIVATCELVLEKTPEVASNINVYLDDTVLPKDPVDGWSLEGNKVTLLGTACEKVLAGDVLSVRVIVGCPTILPK